MGLETFGINILTPLQTLLVVLGLLGGGVGLSIFNSETEDEEDDASS